MNPRATLAATILGSSLAFIDGSVVNVALPALARDLHVAAADLSWAINAYLLPLGILTLLGGALGDHFGRRRIFQIGLAVFALASAVCAVTPSLAWLLAARALQGLGAALLMPNSLAILGTEFSGEARGRAIGTWAAAGALASAVGPVLGGWLVDVMGWRTIFILNLPIAAVAAYLAWRYVTDGKELKPAPLDVFGAALATAGLGAIIWALTDASESNPHASGWPPAILGFVLIGAFLWCERRLGEQAMMPLSVFAGKTFDGLNLLTFFLYGSVGGLMVLLPFLLIVKAHWLASAAGAALLPLPLLIGGVSRLMGHVAERYGARLPLTVGCSVVAVGFAWFARLSIENMVYWRDVFPATLLIALGMSACVAPLTTAVMTSVAANRVGLASGFNSAVARVAGLIATAMLGFVFAQQETVQSFGTAFRAAALVGAASAVLAAAAALLLVKSKPN